MAGSFVPPTGQPAKAASVPALSVVRDFETGGILI